ncbi:hypothetical protein DFJ58DRAFT_746859 [Suillus subalutaceus]|uniref:uncharacterized protein n=1 Tax=Suillus subalutaceus TaxID=48586 RepID=UPI001B866C56|nr:uncharacterized protein DFJ58DRAFT_746859 [Suillus subalutaceus]KAG1848324.1 hypothetical protein DFJ58DRAFT_746859 [Suillus subalutaceus]
MSENYRPDPPPRTSRSSRADVAENSNRPRRGICQFMRKVKNGLTKKLPKRFKQTRNRTTTVQNVEIEGAFSSQKVEDTVHLHPSNDNRRPTTLEIPSDSMNQGLSGEPASQAQAAHSGEEEGPNHQLVDAILQGACDGMESTRLLGEHATSMASAANNAPAGLAAVDNFETTYLQPLKISNAVLEKIVDVHPYTKIALGVLSAASNIYVLFLPESGLLLRSHNSMQIIIAQAERDESIYSLLKKLAEIYRFMTQDDSLGKIESMRGIVGKIIQQTRKRVSKNFLSETDGIIKKYSDTLDGLVQQFRDQVDWDVIVFVQPTGDTLDLGDIAYAKGAGLNTMKQCLPGTPTEILS